VLKFVLKDNTKPLTLLVELKTTVEFAEFVLLIVKLVTTLDNLIVNIVLKVSSLNQEPTNTVKLLAQKDISLMLTLECVSLVNTLVKNVPLQELMVTVSVVSLPTVSDTDTVKILVNLDFITITDFVAHVILLV
jgi:hypothetical protein